MSLDHTLETSTGDGEALTECGEKLAVVRKKALLRILACFAAGRAGVQVSEDDVEATSNCFRRGFGLENEEEFAKWMAARKLSQSAFVKAMHDMAMVHRLGQVYAREIDDLIHDQIAVSTARLRLAE